jgi:hypothetical protein
MLLAIGAIALCSSALAQLAVNQNINGNVVTGMINNVSANATLPLGTLVSFTSTSGSTTGQTFTYQVVLTPSTNPAGQLSDIANAINNTFNNSFVQGSGGPVSPNRFGSNAGEYSVSLVQQVPFDLGLSAVLAAGAFGAVRAARARKKNQVPVV